MRKIVFRVLQISFITLLFLQGGSYAQKICIIRHIKVLKLPYSKQDGGSWDFKKDPDPFLAIMENGELIGRSKVRRNFDINDLPASFFKGSRQKLNTDKSYMIHIYDEDKGIATNDFLNRNDRMGMVQFDPSEYSSSEPKFIELSGGSDVSLIVYVKWKK